MKKVKSHNEYSVESSVRV